MAVARSDTSTTDPVPGSRPLEKGGRNAEGQGQRAVAVPQGATLADGVLAFGRAEDVRHTAAGPEGRGVVAGLVGVGAPDSVPVAHRAYTKPGIADGASVSASSPRRRNALGRMFVRNTSAESSSRCMTARPSSLLNVQREGALPPVGQRERQVDAATFRPDPLGGQAAVGIPFVGSMWMTSAPQSASSAPATGTKTHWASSTTLTPSNGCSGHDRGSLSYGAGGEHHKRDDTVGPGLVDVVVGPGVGHDLPEAGLLGIPGRGAPSR